MDSETETEELTVSDLRKACKAAGVGMSIKTYSHGPHVSFTVGGIGGDVYSVEFYKEHESQFQALQMIRERFHGIKHNGRHLYGLKVTT